MREFKRGDLITIIPYPRHFGDRWAGTIMRIYKLPGEVVKAPWDINKTEYYHGLPVALLDYTLSNAAMSRSKDNMYYFSPFEDCLHTTSKDFLKDFYQERFLEHLDAIREILNAEI